MKDRVVIPITQGTIIVDRDRVTTRFLDGCVALFIPPVHDPEFQRIAREEFGYDDALRYGLHHEIAHSIIADELHRVSRVVWANAHGGEQGVRRAQEEDRKREFPNRCEDDEHRTNRFLLFMHTGEIDPEGSLMFHFETRERLDRCAARLASIFARVDEILE